MPNKPLRIVTFNFLPLAYDFVVDWIHEKGHKHVLAVTTPGPKTRPTPQYIGIVQNAPRDVDILVTTRLRTVAAPLIRALEPDLITCLSFPYRIPPEIVSIPKYGAVNLHPAPLPAYRGPNIARVFYEGWHEFGATLHWIAEEFDTGNILSRKAAPMPDEIVEEKIIPVFVKLIKEALTEGVERALAGERGQVQDDSQASYAAPFTEEEYWLDLSESQRVLQNKVTGLNFANSGEAKVAIGKERFSATGLRLIAGETADSPGSIVEREDGALVVAVSDGLVRLDVTLLEDDNSLK
jgi:methionyl-tRNA formyltransferase